MTIQVNLRIIKDFNPCESGIRNYLEYHREFEGTIQEFLQLDNIPYQDKIWLCKKLVPTQ